MFNDKKNKELDMWSNFQFCKMGWFLQGQYYTRNYKKERPWKIPISIKQNDQLYDELNSFYLLLVINNQLLYSQIMIYSINFYEILRS